MQWWSFKLTITRKSEKQDRAAIWAILKPIFRAGESYAVDTDISKIDALTLWCDGNHMAYVAQHADQILGTYYICPNHSGSAAHICNCGFATHADARGACSL